MSMRISKKFKKELQLYQLALEKWGSDAQIGMLVEEIGEVLVALNKVNRQCNNCSREHLIEELVDLEIMVEQMHLVIGYPHIWELKKREKLRRLAKLLEVNYDG